MNAFAILLPVIFPIIAGACLLPVKFSDRKARQRVVLPIIVLNAIFALYAIFFADSGAITIFRFSNRLSLALHVDGLSKIFGTMVSLLWIPTTIYAFEYMTHEGHEDRFFSFFTMTFGVVIGIAFADNFLTMYLFYEFLTLVTLPIVMHQFDNKARHAGKTYVLYMMFGASLAFIGFVFVLAFFGFGVKAAVFPFYRWLPKASVAPTPVTALLHAVAVVKSGVFAIIRLTYYAFGTEFLIGTWAQYVMLIAASITIVFGSTVALRTPHIKRRFAYSTISNLSYIIFGVAIMTPTGLAAGMLHMIYHAVIKITLFFTAGAILYKTHREYLYEVEGFGKLMPITFATMAITGIGLVGVPPFAGFHSKWALATAATASGNPVTYIGVVALILSALLTALYIFSIIIRAYFPREKEYPAGYYDHVSDPNKYMTVPLIVLAAVSILMGLMPATLLGIMNDAIMGIL